MFFSGCEQTPRVSPRVDNSPMPTNVVDSAGRGDYTWEISAEGTFVVEKPLELSVFSEIDSKQIAEKIASLEEPRKIERREGMDDDVYESVSRLTDPQFDTTPIMTLPISQSKEGRYAVDQAGDRLALVNGSVLEVWDLKSKLQTAKIQLPNGECQQLAWYHDSPHLVLRDANRVYRIDSASGQVIHTWSPPNGDELSFLVLADNSSICAISTSNGKLYALGKELQLVNTFTGPQLRDAQISIHPDAEWVVASSENDFVRWYVDVGRSDYAGIVPTKDLSKNVRHIPGKTVDYFVDKFSISSYVQRNVPNPRSTALQLNPMIHCYAIGNMENGLPEWLTLVISRPTEAGQRNYSAVDLYYPAATNSTEFPLGTSPILELRTNRGANVLAVRDASQIRVFRRQCWKSLEGYRVMDELARYMIDGRFDQVELAGQMLKEVATTRTMSGGLHYLLTQVLGEYWATREIDDSNPANRDILRKLNQWRSRKSEVAILASSFRHAHIAYRVSKGMIPNTWDENGLSEVEKRRQAIKRELTELLKATQPSFAAIRLYLTTSLEEHAQLEELQPVIKQLILVAPFSPSTHARVAYYQLPQSGGAIGQASAYLLAIGRLLPGVSDRSFYTRSCLELVRLVGIEQSPYLFQAVNTGLSANLLPSRILASVDEIIQGKIPMTAFEVEMLIKIAHDFKKPKVAQKLAEFHAQNFVAITTSQSQEKIVSSRESLERKAE